MTIRELESALSDTAQGLIENANFALSDLVDDDPISKRDAVELIRQVFYALDASNDAVVKFLKQRP